MTGMSSHSVTWVGYILLRSMSSLGVTGVDCILLLDLHSEVWERFLHHGSSFVGYVYLWVRTHVLALAYRFHCWSCGYDFCSSMGGHLVGCELQTLHADAHHIQFVFAEPKDLLKKSIAPPRIQWASWTLSFLPPVEEHGWVWHEGRGWMDRKKPKFSPVLVDIPLLAGLSNKQSAPILYL